VKAKPVVLREVAARDVDAVLVHYLEEGGDSLARDFIEAIEAAFRHIGAHAASGSSRYAVELDVPDLRFWPLKGFPQLISYVEREDHVDVWRVLHGRGDIPAWLQPAE
jgi:toxin ParE1/3/4